MKLETLNDMPPWEWPEEAGEYIFSVVNDKTAAESDRILAAEMAGSITVMNDKMAAGLLNIIRDNTDPEELRCTAAISLGPALEQCDLDEIDENLDDSVLSEKVFREIQGGLRDTFQDTGNPKNLRRRVLEASVRAPQDWQQKAVREAYASKDEEWILTAIFSMGYIDGFEKQILESLKSKNPDIFYEAVCAAGNWGIAEAWPYIEKLLTAEDIETHLLLAAIEAAPNINLPGSVDILMELSNSDDEEIAEAAEEALAFASAVYDDFSEEDEDDMD